MPRTTTELHESIPAHLKVLDPPGLQGRNSRGQIGYSGPRPPVGDPAHHYHFEVFALDRTLTIDPGADRDRVLQAMNGHVLARGETTALYRRAR